MRTLFIVLITVFLLSCSTNPVIPRQVTDQLGSYIIGFHNPPGLIEKDFIRNNGGKIKTEYKIIPAIHAELSQQAVIALQNNPNVDYIEADIQYQTVPIMLNRTSTTHNTMPGGDVLPRGVWIIDSEDAWAAGYTGISAKVGIMDSGIDYTHPDFALTYAGGYDFYRHDNDPIDEYGHGTHVAGTVAASMNASGVVGVAHQAQLYSLRVGDGYQMQSAILEAFDWAIANDLDVLNMSFGGSTYTQSMYEACEAAYASGIVLVAAAGNNGNAEGIGDTIIFPARFESVIAVGATYWSRSFNHDPDDRTKWSAIGPTLELMAPGSGIQSCKIGGGIWTKSGTSMSTPHVVGVVALLIEYGINDPDYIRQILQDTAIDRGDPGRDNLYGYGRVDAYRAVTEVGPYIPPPPPSYGTLSGHLYNDWKGKPLANSKVTILNAGISTKTNRQGYYEFTDLEFGIYYLKVFPKGPFNPRTREVTLDEDIIYFDFHFDK